MEDDERITEDTLFLACTRPAMVLGVPVEAMGMNVIVTGFVYLVGHSLLYLSLGVALHFLFRAIVKHDHNAFRVLFMWFETKGRALDDHVREHACGVPGAPARGAERA